MEQGWVQKEAGVILHGDQGAVWDEEVLEMDGGDGCQQCVISVDDTLDRGYHGNLK